jgi:hypothetical protein
MQHHYCIYTTLDPTVSGLTCSDESEKQLMQYCKPRPSRLLKQFLRSSFRSRILLPLHISYDLYRALNLYFQLSNMCEVARRNDAEYGATH